MLCTHDDTYKTAVNHYLSPKRQDNVKIKWERPFSQDLTKALVSKILLNSQQKPVSIIDFGCGIGEGLTLFNEIIKEVDFPQENLSYTGIDISPEMIKTATDKWQSQPNVNFLLQDFSQGIPTHPTQIYYSCGVPYSHLTKAEMSVVLGHIFRAIKQNQTNSLILIDVLGRYSLEWISQWQESRWAYRMSFLAEAAEEQEPMMMTCYYAPELAEMFQHAARETRCQISSAAFYDRSIMVGRHTTTHEYNTLIPPYRHLVNALYEPQQTTDLAQLLLTCPLPSAPEDVTEFFVKFAHEWNALIATAAHLRQDSGFEQIPTDTSYAEAFKTAVLAEGQSENQGKQAFSEHLELTLAKHLRQLEIALQPGLGISHTLIGVLQVNGSN